MSSFPNRCARAGVWHCIKRRAGVGLLACLGPSGVAMAEKPPDVSFTDIALEIGFQDRLSHGRALVAADFNNDGLVDFYLGNPGDPLVASDESFILWNQGPDGAGQYHFSKGQVLVKGDIAFTAAAADYDNDGDEDLFIGIGGQEGIGLDHLFRNSSSGVFSDVSTAAGIRGPKDIQGRFVPKATSSGNWADYDNDGDLDLFVAVRYVVQSLPGSLGVRNSLFRNDGHGDSFTDVTDEAGVGSTASSMTSAWADYDNDGWVDLYIPTGWPGGPNKPAGFELYRNMHDGTFRRVPIRPEQVNFGTAANWSSVAADFNNDGWIDIWSGARSAGDVPLEDSHALLINHGNWSFTNEARSSGLAPPGAPAPRMMGGQVGDYDNDGQLDVVMANGGPSAGGVDNMFHNVSTPQTGLRFEDVSSLIDYPAPPDPLCKSPQVNPKYIWANQSDLVDSGMMHTRMNTGPEGSGVDDCGSGDPPPFDETTDLCNPSYPYRGHGTVFYDLDRDGDLDLFMSKGGPRIYGDSVEPNRVFRNDGGNENNWFSVHLTGTVSNRDAVGARVKVVSSGSGPEPLAVYREVYGGSDFSADGPRELQFGLGKNENVDEVDVFWPSGIRTVLTGLSPNQRLELTENAVLSNNFNDGRAPGWTPLTGRWAVGGDEYRQLSEDPAVSINPTAAGSDFTVVGKLTYRSGSGVIGLLGRASADGRTWYGVRLAGNQAQLYKSVGGPPVALGSPIDIDTMTPGRSYLVGLTFAGDTIQWRVDGKDGVAVSDTSIPSGSIGLYAVKTLASFDNIAVY